MIKKLFSLGFFNYAILGGDILNISKPVFRELIFHQ